MGLVANIIMTNKDETALEFRRLARLNWLFIAVLLVTTIWLSGRWITPDVFALPLGACDLTIYQDRQFAVIACPGHDLIRIWPLPIISPWFEDPLHPDTGQQALLLNAS
jgi:hypothetical protein